MLFFNKFKEGGWDGVLKLLMKTGSSIFKLNSKGTPSVNALIGDKAITTTAHNKYITGIGYAAGNEGVEIFTPSDGVTQYRVKCSAECRVIEDAANLAQAQAWLNVGAAEAAGDVEYIKVPANAWSEWQYFPDGFVLSNIYISLNATGTGGTATVEAK